MISDQLVHLLKGTCIAFLLLHTLRGGGLLYGYLFMRRYLMIEGTIVLKICSRAFNTMILCFLIVGIRVNV